jgi:hypothetical protein
MGIGWEHNRENIFACVCIAKMIQESSSQEPLGQKSSNLHES